MAAWRSGYAGDCKSSYTGSIPVAASNFLWASDGIGIRATLKMSWSLLLVGSSPTLPTFLMLEKKRKKNLVISADDFGKSELANRNILRLAEVGKLDRVSVMADGNFSKGEIERLAVSSVKLDVHLSLDNFLENRNEVKEGFAKRVLVFLGNYLFGMLGGKKKVEQEWESQIEGYIKLFGKKPDGLNSHRYDHFFPIYFPTALKLAKRYNIERIRFGKILPAGKNGLTSGVLKYFWKRNRKKFADSKLKAFDYCANLDWVENPENFFWDFPEGEIELVVHPERREEMEIIDKYF